MRGATATVLLLLLGCCEAVAGATVGRRVSGVPRGLAAFGPASAGPTAAERRALAELAARVGVKVGGAEKLLLRSAGGAVSASSSSDSSASDACTPYAPLVIVPSLVGNQLDVRRVNKPRAHLWCQANTDWYRGWLPPNSEFLPGVVDCWASDMELFWRGPGNYSEPEGVELRIPYFGGVDGVASLRGNWSESPIWAEIIYILLTKAGYKAGVDVVSAPMDWRTGPDAMAVPGGSFDQLKKLIEDTVERCGGRKAVLTSLSWGGPTTALFLERHVSAAWKAKYVEGWVSFSGVFGGSSWAAQALVDNVGKPWPDILPAALQRETIGQWGSMAWLLPAAQVFGPDRLVVRTPSTNYTVARLGELLLRGNKAAAPILDYILKEKYSDFPDVGVRTICIHGSQLPTLDTVSFSTDDFGGVAANTTGNGDGTVLLEALTDVPKKWSNTTVIDIKGMSHGGAVFDTQAIEILYRFMGIPIPPSPPPPSPPSPRRA